MKVFVIIRIEFEPLSEKIVCIRSKESDANELINRLNKYSGSDYHYILKSIIVDGEIQ